MAGPVVQRPVVHGAELLGRRCLIALQRDAAALGVLLVKQACRQEGPHGGDAVLDAMLWADGDGQAELLQNFEARAGGGTLPLTHVMWKNVAQIGVSAELELLGIKRVILPLVLQVVDDMHFAADSLGKP